MNEQLKDLLLRYRKLYSKYNKIGNGENDSGEYIKFLELKKQLKNYSKYSFELVDVIEFLLNRSLKDIEENERMKKGLRKLIEESEDK